MPSITTYSPYEKLALFQSVARYGTNASAFQNIAISLNNNECIPDSASRSDHFSADALQSLYWQYIEVHADEKDRSVNGDLDGQRSPKRRKLLNSRHDQDGISNNDERVLQDTIAELYATYKSEAVRQIQEDEAAFAKLKDEIQALEVQIEADTKEPESLNNNSSIKKLEHDTIEAENRVDSKTTGLQPPSRPDSVINDPKASPAARTVANDASAVRSPNAEALSPKPPVPKPPTPSDGKAIQLQSDHQQQSKGFQSVVSQQSESQTQGNSTKHASSPTVQRTNYGPMQIQPVYSPNPPPVPVVPSMTGNPQRPLARPQSVSSQNRGSPLPYQGQHTYPAYQQYPPPQWHPHMSVQQYSQATPYAPQAYYPPPPNGRHLQSPQQIQYGPYQHTAPVHYMPQQQQWRGQQWQGHPASTVTTPISRPDSRLSLPGSGSSTPWKRARQQNQYRTRSPPPLNREVSPLTDKEDTPTPERTTSKVKIDERSKIEQTPTQPQPRRRGRPPSKAPSAAPPSRSQSITSRASDAQNEKQHVGRRAQIIKAEPPSTPLPIQSSDNEQRSSGRRGRPRGSTSVSNIEKTRPVGKRKRESASPASPISSPQASNMTPASRLMRSHDPSLIVVSKKFARTSQLLLNEITSHKLAGIFAKPLSERDAPGYKDVVLRPQDLKGIKAAVSKGSRAALAAIEANEAEHELNLDKETSSATTSAAGPGPIGNGFYLVPKTADLVPPKGIANSAQLEMELVRMFANAVMFNPLPASERGFGRNLRLRKNGGDVNANVNLKDVSASDDSESGSSPGVDEGGIISDAREMFNDVVETVSKWRELEGERLGTTAEVSLSRHGSLAVPNAQNLDNGRQFSISASSNIGDDETAAGESEGMTTPIPSITTGLGRKRRRIAEA